MVDGRGPVLRCESLRKRFGTRLAVDDVSFEIAPGETYGLLGPNGAGKTTTISMGNGASAVEVLPRVGVPLLLGMLLLPLAAVRLRLSLGA